jgi:hypothetical protein
MRLAAMLTTRAHALSTTRLLAAALLMALALAACGGAAAAPSPSAGPAETARPTPTAVPGDPGSSGGAGGGTDPGTGGGGSDPGTGTGGGPIIPLPPDPNQNPLLGQAHTVVPALNLINQHPISVQLVRGIVQADGTALVELRWWSGVAPCNQLDHVDIVRDDAARTVHLTVIEGSGPGDQVCIDLAELRATTVNLGALGTGTWTISAEGDAPAIPLEVK